MFYGPRLGWPLSGRHSGKCNLLFSVISPSKSHYGWQRANSCCHFEALLLSVSQPGNNLPSSCLIPYLWPLFSHRKTERRTDVAVSVLLQCFSVGWGSTLTTWWWVYSVRTVACCVVDQLLCVLEVHPVDFSTALFTSWLIVAKVAAIPDEPVKCLLTGCLYLLSAKRDNLAVAHFQQFVVLLSHLCKRWIFYRYKSKRHYFPRTELKVLNKFAINKWFYNIWHVVISVYKNEHIRT